MGSQLKLGYGGREREGFASTGKAPTHLPDLIKGPLPLGCHSGPRDTSLYSFNDYLLVAASSCRLSAS